MLALAGGISILLGIWTLCVISGWRHNRRITKALREARIQLLSDQARMVAEQVKLLSDMAMIRELGDTLLAQAQDIVQSYGDKVAAIVSEVDEEAGKTLKLEAAKFRAMIEVQRISRKSVA